MSLITRCPACGTMFKVVTDQLKVSQGWVRCGHCADVFDASQHLQSAQIHNTLYPVQASSQAESAWQTSTDTGHSIFDPGQWQQDQRSVLLDESGTLRLDDHGQAVRVLPVNSPVAVEPQQAPMPAAELSSQLVQPLSELMSHVPTAGNVDSSSLPAATELPGSAGPAGISEAPDIPDLTEPPLVSDEVSFVKDARRQARWHQPLVRIGLGLLSLLLALLLLLQVVVQQKDDVAALEPSLRPWLQMLCAQLQCRLDAPRRIEAVVIENSAFNKVNADTYRLSFTIKNTGAVALAMPSLEVTLTDTRDQALVRRVFTLAQLGETRGALVAGAESGGLVLMQVSAATAPAAVPALGASSASGNFSPTAVAGYRLLAFYP